MKTRGIIVLPDSKPDGNFVNTFEASTRKDIDRIRRYLTYWDKIDLPDNPLIAIDLPREANFLISEGVLSKSRVPLSKLPGNSLEDKFINCHIEIFKRYNSQEPGQWALGQTGPCWSIPTRLEEGSRTALVELYNVLPDPDHTVSLEDVYKFKQNRKDELQALRGHMDEMFQEIVNSNDIPHAKTMAIESLERSLADLNRVAGETWTSRLMQSVSIELNLPEMAKSALSGAGMVACAEVAAGIQPYAIPLVIGAFLGIAHSSLKFSITKEMFIPNIPQHLKDFAYLYKP